MQATSPIPRNSPLTVTTSTSRYESSSRNHVSSPRNYSLSPTSQVERSSPINYVSASTQRVASPIHMHRVTSPITTITHRVTTPLTSPLTVKVSTYAKWTIVWCWKLLLSFEYAKFEFSWKSVQTGTGETYKMTEKISSYKTSSNYTSSDDTRRSPSYAVGKRISSPGKIINNFHHPTKSTF